MKTKVKVLKTMKVATDGIGYRVDTYLPGNTYIIEDRTLAVYGKTPGGPYFEIDENQNNVTSLPEKKMQPVTGVDNSGWKKPKPKPKPKPKVKAKPKPKPKPKRK